jgi:HlyD family secretion protein
VVLARQVDPGQTVAASFNTPTLFVIAEDLTKMKLEVAIDEADVGEVKQGQKASFTVDAFPGRTFPATITRVDVGSNLSAESAASSSTSNSATTTGQVVSYAADLTVSNPSGELRPGMTATADIVTSDRKNVLLIPNAALRFQPQSGDTKADSSGGITGALTYRPRRRGDAPKTATLGRGAAQTVYVKGEGGQPRAVQITTGDTDGMQTEVLSGDLRLGMEVITGQLSAGQEGGSRRPGGGQRHSGGGAASGGRGG